VGHEANTVDEANVRALVRRVLRSGGRDLDAVEELVFLQDHDDPFAVTTTTDPTTDRRLLHDAFEVELRESIAKLLNDDRLTPDKDVELASATIAASGRLFDPVIALAPYAQALAAARRADGTAAGNGHPQDSIGRVSGDPARKGQDGQRASEISTPVPRGDHEISGVK
jgi:hypothetical protein